MKLGVVGAGSMGAEIALVQALAGFDVLLADRNAEVLQNAMARLARLLEKRGTGSSDSLRDVLDRIQITTNLDEFGDCEIVTEAVFEHLEVKSSVLQQLTAVLAPTGLIVTNTSTIPISVLASKLEVAWRPNFIGMHYFSPVSRMKLVEVIAAFETSDAAVQRAMALANETGKVPIRVKDVPGFAVNRVLHVFLIEAVRLIEEGVVSVEDLDTACRLGLGHPMGPFELMDATTSSLCLTAQKIMFEAYGERFRPRPLMKQRVAAGLVGGRGGKGWRSCPRSGTAQARRKRGRLDRSGSGDQPDAFGGRRGGAPVARQRLPVRLVFDTVLEGSTGDLCLGRWCTGRCHLFLPASRGDRRTARRGRARAERRRRQCRPVCRECDGHRRLCSNQ